MSKIKVGRVSLTGYDESLDALRKEIDEAEATLRAKGATSFETDYYTLDYSNEERLFIEGYREQTEVEKAEEAAQQERNRQHQVRQLEEQLKRLKNA